MRRFVIDVRPAILVMAAALLGPGAAFGQKKLVRLMFNAPVMESPSPMKFNFFSMGQPQGRTLHEWVETIEDAAKDSEIAGAVMIIENAAVGMAQAEELSRALKVFRAAGKKIYCYLDEADNRAYLLASQADHVTLAEHSDLMITGIHAEMMFLRGMFDKVGIEPDFLNCGDYKTAVEPYMRTEPSKENVEMTNWLLDGIFETMVGLIASGRNLSKEQVVAAIDAAPILAEEAKQRKLVDAVSSYPSFKQMIQKEYGKDVKLVADYGKKKSDMDLDMANPFAFWQKLGEIFSGGEKKETKPGIGLVYIDGGIVTGRNEPDFMGGGGTAGSTTIRAAFEQARQDNNVKAVVVRVDSPGGSALASDIIWEAAKRCGAEKPVIVSMGNVAGSGGYYVSIPGDVIFAEESTITGSIGVLGGKLVLKGIMDWAGLGITEFGRGKHSGLMSTNRKWSEEERGVMRKYIDAIYEQFKGRVMACRGDRIKGELDKLAGGRVYTGKQALAIGLIDKIGGLNDALDFAAGKVGLGKDYEVYVVPKPKDIVSILKAMFGEEEEDEWSVRSAGVQAGLPTRGSLLAEPMLQPFLPLLGQLAPHQAGMAVRALRNAMIMQRERVGMFMPVELNIR